MTIASGSNQGLPVLQTAYDNYANPSAENSSLLAEYNTQTCTNGPIEGDAPYPGYNYYQVYLQELYAAGIAIYFEYVTLPEYGLCLRYSALLPWNNPALPRSITYTLTFQNYTGYLLTYDLSGTEYCCPGVNLYCPNSGNCSDGTIPQFTYAMTNQTYYDYQLYEASDWPDGFFGAYCPFSSSDVVVVPTAAPTTPASVTSNDDDNNSSSSSSALSNNVVAIIVLAVFLGLSVMVNIYFGVQMMFQVRLKKGQPTTGTEGSNNENPLHL